MPFLKALFVAIQDVKVSDVAVCLQDVQDNINELADEEYNQLSPLMFAILCRSDNEESQRIIQLIMAHPLTKINLKTPLNETAIHCAALQGSVELMDAILAQARREAEMQGSDPDEVLRELVNLAANLPQDEDEDEDEDDTLTLQTPLYLAVEEGKVDVVSALLNAGANPNTDQSECHPLINAILRKERCAQFADPSYISSIAPLDTEEAVLVHLSSALKSDEKTRQSAKQRFDHYVAIIKEIKSKMTPEAIMALHLSSQTSEAGHACTGAASSTGARRYSFLAHGSEATDEEEDTPEAASRLG